MTPDHHTENRGGLEQICHIATLTQTPVPYQAWCNPDEIKDEIVITQRRSASRTQKARTSIVAPRHTTTLAIGKQGLDMGTHSYCFRLGQGL